MSPTEWQLDRYRPLLRILARRIDLDPRLQARFDWSDVVHDTLLKAHAQLEQFRGQSEGELIAWLQTIFTREVADRFRRERAARRDPRREQRLQALVDESSLRMEHLVAGDQSTPSHQLERQEQRVRLAEALEQLPEDQRTAIIEHHLSGASVREVAEKMGRTEKSVAGLLLRGLKKLRELMNDG